MKTKITTIIVLTISIFIGAQSPILPLNTNGIGVQEGAYVKDLDNVLPQYEGTWQYSENGKIVTLYLQKFMVEKSRYYEDKILGKYKVVNNGITISHTTNEEWDFYDLTLVGRTFLENRNSYILGLEDKDRCNLTGSVFIKINPNNPNEMEWKLQQNEFWLEPDCYTYPNMPEFTLPLEMTLQKIE